MPPALNHPNLRLSERGVYCLANDEFIEWFQMFARSLRHFSPTLPLTVIPYDTRIEQLQRLRSQFQFELVPEAEAARFDALEPKIMRMGRYAGMFRKWASFFGAYDEFMFLDSDIAVTMPLEELSQMADLTARLKMERIFYLNLGEPFLSPTIGRELPLLREKNTDAYIRVSTNGILLNTDAKREAALQLSDIMFSVHGISDAMCEKYMLRGSFEKAYDAMKKMAAYRDARGLRQPLLEWKYLLFNWNDHPRTIERAMALAREAGVDILSFWPTHNPFYGMSWRYHFGRFNQVGAKSWKGRELVLRPENDVNPRRI